MYVYTPSSPKFPLLTSCISAVHFVTGKSIVILLFKSLVYFSVHCVFQFYGFLQVHNVMYLTLSYSPITLKISCSNFSLFIFPISLPYLKLLATTAAFTLYSFTFSKSRIVRTKQTFSDCLLSLSNVNLTFSMSFCSLIFHLFLSLNNILLYGCTTVYSN